MGATKIHTKIQDGIEHYCGTALTMEIPVTQFLKPSLGLDDGIDELEYARGLVDKGMVRVEIEGILLGSVQTKPPTTAGGRFGKGSVTVNASKVNTIVAQAGIEIVRANAKGATYLDAVAGFYQNGPIGKGEKMIRLHVWVTPGIGGSAASQESIKRGTDTLEAERFELPADAMTAASAGNGKRMIYVKRAECTGLSPKKVAVLQGEISMNPETVSIMKKKVATIYGDTLHKVLERNYIEHDTDEEVQASIGRYFEKDKDGEYLFIHATANGLSLKQGEVRQWFKHFTETIDGRMSEEQMQQIIQLVRYYTVSIPSNAMEYLEMGEAVDCITREHVLHVAAGEITIEKAKKGEEEEDDMGDDDIEDDDDEDLDEAMSGLFKGKSTFFIEPRPKAHVVLIPGIISDAIKYIVNEHAEATVATPIAKGVHGTEAVCSVVDNKVIYKVKLSGDKQVAEAFIKEINGAIGGMKEHVRHVASGGISKIMIEEVEHIDIMHKLRKGFYKKVKAPDAVRTYTAEQQATLFARFRYSREHEAEGAHGLIPPGTRKYYGGPSGLVKHLRSIFPQAVEQKSASLGVDISVDARSSRECKVVANKLHKLLGTDKNETALMLRGALTGQEPTALTVSNKSDKQKNDGDKGDVTSWRGMEAQGLLAALSHSSGNDDKQVSVSLGQGRGVANEMGKGCTEHLRGRFDAMATDFQSKLADQHAQAMISAQAMQATMENLKKENAALTQRIKSAEKSGAKGKS